MKILKISLAITAVVVLAISVLSTTSVVSSSATELQTPIENDFLAHGKRPYMRPPRHG